MKWWRGGVLWNCAVKRFSFLISWSADDGACALTAESDKKKKEGGGETSPVFPPTEHFLSDIYKYNNKTISLRQMTIDRYHVLGCTVHLFSLWSFIKVSLLTARDINTKDRISSLKEKVTRSNVYSPAAYLLTYTFTEKQVEASACIQINSWHKSLLNFLGCFDWKLLLCLETRKGLRATRSCVCMCVCMYVCTYICVCVCVSVRVMGWDRPSTTVTSLPRYRCSTQGKLAALTDASSQGFMGNDSSR